MKNLFLLLVLFFPLEIFAQEISAASEFELVRRDILSLPAEQRANVRYMTSGFYAGTSKQQVDVVSYRHDEFGKIQGLVLDKNDPQKFHKERRVLTHHELLNRIAFFGLNSISTNPGLVQPEFVEGTEKRIIRFYLSNYRLRADTWEWFTAKDPYFAHLQDASLSKQTGTLRPIIRTDWFLAKAFSDPTYRILLNNSLKFHNPKTADEIHQNFKFVLQDSSDIEREYWASVSGENSFVAIQSRRLRRYSGVLDYIHISDDYKSNVDFIREVKGKKVYVIKDPVEHLLDPDVVKKSKITKNINGFLYTGDVVYEPDGHEAIFQLPNELQGYYISDAQNKLIDKADPELGVRDTRNSYEPVIANAKSCIWCHERGMNPPTNTSQQHLGKILDLKAKSPEVVDLIKSLYDTKYPQKIKEDSDRYCTAVGISNGLDATDNAAWFRMYIQWYDYERITQQQAAKELGVTVEELQAAAKVSTSFRLVTLFGNPQTPIPRKIWESIYQSTLLITTQQKLLQPR